MISKLWAVNMMCSIIFILFLCINILTCIAFEAPPHWSNIILAALICVYAFMAGCQFGQEYGETK